jgi:hypothetical protein
MMIVTGKMAMAVCILTVEGCVHGDCDQQVAVPECMMHDYQDA